MLMLNSTDFDDFWPLHVHRALLDNDSRIRNHRYSRGTLVPSLAAVALTRGLFFSDNRTSFRSSLVRECIIVIHHGGPIISFDCLIHWNGSSNERATLSTYNSLFKV